MTERDDIAPADDDGEALPDDALAELAAIADVEPAGLDEVREADAALASLRADLEETRAGLDAERAARLAAVARYREALLAAEPALPAELIEGETLEDIDAAVEAARRAVAQIREQLAGEAEDAAARGFPAGAPGRSDPSAEGMSATEKIAFGLERRA